TTSADGTIRFWDVASWRPRGKSFKGPGIDLDVKISRNGQFLAAGEIGGTATVWEVASGREVAKLRSGVEFYWLGLSPDGRKLAMACGGDTGARCCMSISLPTAGHWSPPAPTRRSSCGT